MTAEKKTHPLKKYLRDNEIRVEDAAKHMGINPQQLYRVMRGKCRPNLETTKKIYEYLKGTLSTQDIRPELDRPKCPCCKRLLKQYHIDAMLASEKKKNKMKEKKEVENDIVIHEKKQRKSSRGLLFP